MAPTARPSRDPTQSPSPTEIADADPTQAFDDVLAVMAATIAQQRPDLVMSLQPDRLDGSWILDGSVADASGPGRLYVVVSPRPGDLLRHPCDDPDFRQGGRCSERVLSDDDILVIRDRVTANGVTTVLAVLIHSDRSGIAAEASNQAIGLAPFPRVDREIPPATRALPAYSAQELAGLLRAIDRRLTAAGLP